MRRTSLLLLFALTTSPPELRAAAAPGRAHAVPFGPGNGRIWSLEVEPGAPSTLYATFEYGGLFKSVDGGRSWAWSGRDLGDRKVRAVAADDPAHFATVAGAGAKRSLGVSTA